MEISIERSGETLIAIAGGRVDGTNSQELHDGLEAIFEEDDRAVVLDLEHLTYLSSSGLRVVLLIARTLQRRNVKFALCSLSTWLREVFQVSGSIALSRFTHPAPRQSPR